MLRGLADIINTNIQIIYLDTKVKYKKPFISFEEQLKKLICRGLGVENQGRAINILKYNSYYRLRAYTYPFQDNTDAKHPFIQKVSIEEIYDLYNFDRKLRSLLFQALEKIEIAFRTQIIYQFAKTYGSHWQLEPRIFKDTARFARHLELLNNEVERSKETFINHYHEKYAAPTHPPCWMSLEISSFGTLSMIYQNLKPGKEKDAVAENLGLKKIRTLENWIFCFNHLRNICAHHSRLWNKRLTALPFLPYNEKQPFLNKKEINEIYPNKVYAIICCIYYILRAIDSSNLFKENLINLMKNCPLKQEKEMGFPNNWQGQTVWNSSVT